MTDLFLWFRSLPTPFNMVVMIVLISVSAGVINCIAKEIRKFACHRQELEFKRELVDRGLSVDEIERVVRVHQGESARKS